MAGDPFAVIIGFPVKHARSPLLHAHWLAQYGLKGRYERADVKPGDVGAFLRGLPAKDCVGGNVTVPHKEEAFSACDRLTARAQAVGAVNTFWFEGGQLVGDNTDGLGFLAHLDQAYPGWDQRQLAILLLGAGGAARGIAQPLLERRPARLMIANRSSGRADQLVADLRQAGGTTFIERVDWDQKDAALGRTDLVINTTSLGMAQNPPLALAVENLPAQGIVADIVYVPLETDLLRAARERGLRTLDGLGMLMHQAAPGFERWFGVRPRVTEALRDMLIADLTRNPR